MDLLTQTTLDKWSELDQKFYGAEENLDALISAYVRAHDRELRER